MILASFLIFFCWWMMILVPYANLESFRWFWFRLLFLFLFVNVRLFCFCLWFRQLKFWYRVELSVAVEADEAVFILCLIGWRCCEPRWYSAPLFITDIFSKTYTLQLSLTSFSYTSVTLRSIKLSQSHASSTSVSVFESLTLLSMKFCNYIGYRSSVR